MAKPKKAEPISGGDEGQVEEREEGRRTSDRKEQQDLNQGMSTGSHDTTRTGVDWPSSYRVHTDAGQPKEKAGAPKNDERPEPKKLEDTE
jgi:hypothetical protein